MPAQASTLIGWADIPIPGAEPAPPSAGSAWQNYLLLRHAEEMRLEALRARYPDRDFPTPPDARKGAAQTLAAAIIQGAMSLAAPSSPSWGIKVPGEVTDLFAELRVIDDPQDLDGNRLPKLLLPTLPQQIQLLDSRTVLITLPQWRTQPVSEIRYVSSLQYLQVRLDAPYTGVVPEPSTWALMAAGLGAVGWAARRRQRCGAAGQG